MSDVKRYSPNYMYQEMLVDNDPSNERYVEESDYDTLRARVAELEAGSEPIGRVDIAGGLFIEPHEYDLYRIDDMTPVYTTPQPAPSVDTDATEYALRIVKALHRDHYSDNTKFKPFDDLTGLLSQIDNMVCGWKTAPAAVPSLAAWLSDLEAVLCDPSGNCVIDGSPGDRQIVNSVLAEMRRVMLADEHAHSNPRDYK